MWVIESALELCKILKCYEQDCLENMPVLFTSLKMIQISGQSPILSH